MQNNEQKIDLYSILRRVFVNQSLDVDLPYEIEVDQGYGIEGVSDYCSLEFDKRGEFCGATAWYMHFITERDNLEYEFDMEEFEAYRLCLEQHEHIRALLTEELEKKDLPNDYIESILSQWIKKPSDVHASIEHNNSQAMHINELIKCTCPQDIMLRCGCSCGASIVEKSYNKGFILDHSLSKKGVK